jgi:hypothetical protein
MKTLRQILAIAHTEFRFGLRRGGPVVIPALIGMLFAAGVLLNPLGNLSISRDELNKILLDQAKLEKKGWTENVIRQFSADGMADMIVEGAMEAWDILLLTSLLLLPAATASTLPADRKFGVEELLRSSPINAGSYLTGKVLGVGLTAALVSLVALGTFFGLLEGIFLDTFRVGLPVSVVLFFLKFALLDGLPILIWGLTVGILIGTPFRSRMTAVIPGLAIGILSIFFWLAAFKTPAISFNQLDLPLYYLLQNYHSAFEETIARLVGGQAPPNQILGANAPVVGFGQVVVMYLIILASLAGLFVLARLWLKWKENF